MRLRHYQERTLTQLYEWMENNAGNPCVCLPTGSGKSVVIAELCRRAITEWPDTRIVMLTRSMELIVQNAQKLRTIWPGAPMGIYSASVGRKELGEPITIGGPLSVVNVVDRIGHTDICIVDEAHDISHKDEGSYRKIISKLMAVNPRMRVVGFTASPFRTGHGLITDKPAIFDGLIEPASIEELVAKKYLSVLRSKVTEFKISADGVKKRGGDYIEADLQRVVDTDDNNQAMVDEVIRIASNRKSWMFFCTGVKHAEHIAELLNSRGVSAVAVTGDMPKGERDKAIADFRAGKIRAVTNVNCLSTGFDHSEIDLLVMARPTMSPGLYIQQVGRGMRIAEGKADCLVLDFAGVVATHGPITAVQPPDKAGEGDGEAPVKVCDECGELVHPTCRTCPSCGFEFPPPPEKKFALRNDDIMGRDDSDLLVTDWEWRRHVSASNGLEMLRVRYYGAISDAPIDEYLTVRHPGYPGDKACRTLASIAQSAGVSPGWALEGDLNAVAAAMNGAKPPRLVTFKRRPDNARFVDMRRREW
jgi:DNA repair protein RadD